MFELPDKASVKVPQVACRWPLEVERAHRRRAPLLSPVLIKALRDLAASEGLPLATLIALLLNEGLTRRLRSQP